MRVLICPDKFKGTLSALAAAEAIARGWLQSRPADDLDLLPMSDGGDGFGPVMSRLSKAKMCAVNTIDAAHRPCRAHWWWNAETGVAIIESAQAIGLAQLPPGKYHPFELDTFGLGRLLQAVAQKHARQCIVGIGGSATNDGGFGLARSRGWRFLSARGQDIQRWTDLTDLVEVQPPSEPESPVELIVAVDVQNPFLGPRGATRIYGPQKGLKPCDIPRAEAALHAYRRVLARHFSRDYSRTAGTGAAGGLGFGFRTFFNAELKSGFALFSHQAALPARIQNADLVITGEGAIDISTTMGKGVGEVALRCRKKQVPCWAIAGRIEDSRQVSPWFDRCFGITPHLTDTASAKADAGAWLSKLAALAGQSLKD